MIPVVNISDVMASIGKKTGYRLLDENQGCVNGCNCGISCYTRTQYDKVTEHEDQEGFFVLEGHGKALIGGEEMSMKEGDCFMVPAHTPHAMIKDEDVAVCKVFWFHAAV